MCEISRTSFRGIVGLVSLLTWGALPVGGQTILVSSVFSTASDLEATIGTDTTYTHALVNWGSYNGGKTSVNGVTLGKVNRFDTGASATGTSPQGYAYAITATDGMNGAYGGGLGLPFNGFMYGDGYNPDAFAGDTHTFTLSGLTAGQAYEMRFYAGSWGDSAGQRKFDIAFTDGTSSASYTNYDESGGYAQGTGHHYVSIAYTPADSDVSVVFTHRGATSYDYHFYALTNQVAAVPEPAVGAAFLGVLALAWARLRTRRQAKS